MSNTKQTIQVIPFDSFATSIVAAHKAADKATAKLRDAVQMSLQKFVDTFAQANGRTEDACKALAKAIKESKVANKSVALGIMEAKTWTEYSQSAQRALYWNVDYAPTLKNDADKKLPWSRKATNTATAAGKTVSTDRAALDKTISRVLQQARLLGLTEFAAQILDVTIERLENFKEVEVK